MGRCFHPYFHIIKQKRKVFKDCLLFLFFPYGFKEKATSCENLSGNSSQFFLQSFPVLIKMLHQVCQEIVVGKAGLFGEFPSLGKIGVSLVMTRVWPLEKALISHSDFS